jgi:hypothetical protein
MKDRYILSLLLIVLAFFYGCTEELELNAEYQDITIVYGFMERTDAGENDTTFIKITKAFLGGDARIIAQIRDSSEYPEKLHVELNEHNASNDELISTTMLDTLTISNKELDGQFYAPYQQVYYAVMPVNQTSLYKLKIIRGNKEITSETPIVNKFSITRPGFPKYVNYQKGKSNLFRYTVPEDGTRFELYIRFNFTEVWEDNPEDTVFRYIDWYKTTRTPTYVSPGFEDEVRYQNDIFYSALEVQVPYPDPEQEAKVLRRFTAKADYTVYAAGEEFSTYLEVNGPSTSIVQERPEYTNIVNGLGLFSTRTKVVSTKRLHTDTRNNILDMNLKFVY